MASFFQAYFGPIYKIGKIEISPEIVVKIWANPYSWHLEGLSPMRILVFGFVFATNFDVCWRAYLYFAQVPWIGTEILLLWPRSQGLSLIGRWDQSKPEKMKPLVLPGALYIPCSQLLEPFHRVNHSIQGSGRFHINRHVTKKKIIKKSKKFSQCSKMQSSKNFW